VVRAIVKASEKFAVLNVDRRNVKGAIESPNEGRIAADIHLATKLEIIAINLQFRNICADLATPDAYSGLNVIAGVILRLPGRRIDENIFKSAHNLRKR